MCLDESVTCPSVTGTGHIWITAFFGETKDAAILE